MKMDSKEVIERFSNRLQNAIDPEDMTSVSSDAESLQVLVRAIVVVEGVVDELRTEVTRMENNG